MMLQYWQHMFLEGLRVELNRPLLLMGTLSISSGSAHLYERQWAEVDKYLSRRHVFKLFTDPKGNFHIFADNGEVVVHLFTPDGRLQKIWRDQKAERLERLIAPHISLPAHALYLGRELQKAEFRLQHPES